jgi:hypothetical protein
VVKGPASDLRSCHCVHVALSSLSTRNYSARLVKRNTRIAIYWTEKVLNGMSRRVLPETKGQVASSLLPDTGICHSRIHHREQSVSPLQEGYSPLLKISCRNHPGFDSFPIAIRFHICPRDRTHNGKEAVYSRFAYY